MLHPSYNDGMDVKPPRPKFAFRLRTVLLLFVVIAPFLKLGHNALHAYREREARKAAGGTATLSTSTASNPLGSSNPITHPTLHP